jgi:hypothetical protein
MRTISGSLVLEQVVVHLVEMVKVVDHIIYVNSINLVLGSTGTGGFEFHLVNKDMLILSLKQESLPLHHVMLKDVHVHGVFIRQFHVNIFLRL